MLQRIRRQQRTKKTHSHRTPRHRSPITKKNHRKIPEKPGRQMETPQRTSDARMNRATIADTSLQAYFKKQRDGTLSEDQEQVYQIIKKHGPISCKQTAIRMGKFPNEISGRFTELRNKKDLIKISSIQDGHRQYEAKHQ